MNVLREAVTRLHASPLPAGFFNNFRFPTFCSLLSGSPPIIFLPHRCYIQHRSHLQIFQSPLDSCRINGPDCISSFRSLFLSNRSSAIGYDFESTVQIHPSLNTTRVLFRPDLGPASLPTHFNTTYPRLVQPISEPSSFHRPDPDSNP
ncbi:hypothetical protein PIB30_042206 [Stylosanthes scabra]|uniref:Uncharacterized protein n=1 Tax=Stylosanthes scabra TaxID=79078 RepID=A0ABU6VDS3_9FABA|nr:hypothetical protein [Stylosanthes scabra]